MISFINEGLKVKELYIDTNVLNRIIEGFKKEIITKKETFFKLANMDIKKCNQTINIENILNLLEEYRNESIVSRREKEITLVSYYGSPYITINLCIQSLIQKKLIVAVIEDSMLAINKFLIAIFNNILEEYKICKMIDIFNLIRIEEIKELENNVNNIICIGNANTYCKYKKSEINKLQYIPFKNIAIYCDDDEYLELQMQLYKYASLNGIEAEIYEDDFDEFIECVNLDSKLENVVVFSKSKEIIQKAKNKIKNCKLYINRNPFKNEKFKVII